jgi:hypothetical protein
MQCVNCGIVQKNQNDMYHGVVDFGYQNGKKVGETRAREGNYVVLAASANIGT